MVPGLYSSLDGMTAAQIRLDVLANNLANADTPGFKAELLSVESSAAAEPGVLQPGNAVGRVRVGQRGLDASPGILQVSGNPLDLALAGPGLFVLESPQGERYTRAGTFTRDAEGYLATAQGLRVLGSRGPIAVPATGFRVDANGQIAGGDSIRIVAGPDVPGLLRAGNNLYAPAPGAAPPAELPRATVLQGQLERSNTNVVLAMVDMLATVRNYEAHQRVMQSIDQASGQANEIGRP